MKIFRKSGVTMFSALLPLLILLIVAAAEMIRGSMDKDNQPLSSDLTYGWCTRNGDEISTRNLPKGNVVICHSLTDTENVGRDLCFKTTNANVRVLFDESTAYEYNFVPKSPLYGKSYGMYIHMATIPDGASSVTLELEPLYENVAAGVSMITIEESGRFLNDLYQRELPGYGLCILLFFYGASMLTVGIMTRRSTEDKEIDFFSLGAFSMLFAIYSVNETCVLQLFTGRPEVVRFCAAIALMFISYFPLSFVTSVTQQRDTVLLPTLAEMTILNFILTIVLSLTGISDVALMLTFSHICIAATVVMTSYLMWKAVRNRKKKKLDDNGFLQTVVIGMSSALAGAAIDLIRYLAVKDRILGNSLFTRVGVLIFVVLMGIHLMRERTRHAVEKERSELMETLAYTDVLTGLNNRLAFHQKESEIRKENISCTIIQLDINNLKTVNDVYGHAEGDRHIIEAVNIIRDCFAEIGNCYRTGGDEFIVIAEKADESDLIAALEALESHTADYNEKNEPPVPMQIAYGCANYKAQEDMLETAEQLADKRMYEKKKQMKEQMN